MNELMKDNAIFIEPNSNDNNQNNSVTIDTADAIRSALDNVLSDSKFSASPQMSAFLSYVVHETMAGNADRIKAYTVAVDALGKPTSFDPQNDPSVRVLANRLRASLKNYYANNPEQALFIELYRGSYVPHFIDATGYEHVQKVSKKTTENVSAPPIQRQKNIENLYAPPNNLQATNTLQHGRQGPTDSADRVSLWLLSGGKKFG